MTNVIEEEILNNGEIVIAARGASMWPMLHPQNNIIKLKKADEPLKKYDVVAFRKNDNIVLHRIIKVYENSYDICGDSTYKIEKDIKKQDIIGILSEFVSNSKNSDNIKWIRVDNIFYKIYARLVVLFMPIRRLLLGIYYKLS